jgi:hypothetical protein
MSAMNNAFDCSPCFVVVFAAFGWEGNVRRMTYLTTEPMAARKEDCLNPSGSNGILLLSDRPGASVDHVN